jgi:uncharacterized protein involved in exopolysaccharide biosynthesis
MKPTLLSRIAVICLTLGSGTLLAEPPKATLEINPISGEWKDPQFLATLLATQMQVLRTNEVLHPVIDHLELVQKLGKPREQIAQELRDGLKVQTVNNTSLLEIVLNHPNFQDEKLASEVLTTMVRTYKDLRLREAKARVDLELKELRDELVATKRKAQDTYTKAAKLRQEFEILDPDPESSDALVQISDRNALGKLVAEQADRSVRVAQQAARVRQLSKLRPEELLDALPALKITDPIVENGLSRLVDIDADVAALRSNEVPDSDPRMRALQARRDVYQKKIDERRETILRGERTALNVELETLVVAEEKLAELQKATVKEKNRMQQYIEAKAEYLTARSLMQLIEQRYAAARFDRALAVEPVKVWEVSPGRVK